MTDVFVAPASSLHGELVVPGDKSISHRALLIALISRRPVHLRNLVASGDVDATRDAIVQLGATIETPDPSDPSHVIVTGRGLRGGPLGSITIDARNAGTLARLAFGILAARDGATQIVGDDSLCARPMTRVADPISAMGATVELTGSGTLPATITGRQGPLTAIDYTLPVSSAQVESAIMLAALAADGPTTIHEPAPMRDHTDRMLKRAGVRITRDATSVTVHPADELQLPDTTIPGDPSAAAPFVVAATLLHGSLLRLQGVCMNPGRIGFFELIERMGARVQAVDRRTSDGEPVADLEVIASQVTRERIAREAVPSIIDELPLVGLLAHFCRGATIIRGAGELRHKESDRIEATVFALRAIGVSIDELEDGFVVRGSGRRPLGGSIDARGDHRIAMLGGIAGLVSARGVTIDGGDCVSVSFPGFFDALDALAVR